MIDLISLLGSPFAAPTAAPPDDQTLLELYDDAFTDRVALLLLSTYRRPGWAPALEKKYQTLESRRLLTLDVLARVAGVLNELDPEHYIVFKSIKPYPATPNDTDIIFMGDKQAYERAYDHLLQAGYIFHEWAPQQRTLYDARGKDKIGKGKKGGTYYIDLYQEISTDYFAYLNKHSLAGHVVVRSINNINVRLLRPEPELAIVLYHSVFPERTYQLEHFYVPLYYLAAPDFDVELFIRFVNLNKMNYAVVSSLEITASLHRRFFGFVPALLQTILDLLGRNQREQRLFAARQNTPYMFSPKTFWQTFLYRSMEPYSFKSLMVQGGMMLNPRFALDVMNSIRHRMSEKGTYHLE